MPSRNIEKQHFDLNFENKSDGTLEEAHKDSALFESFKCQHR